MKSRMMHAHRSWLAAQCRRAIVTGAVFVAVLGPDVSAGPEDPVVINGNVIFDAQGNIQYIHASDGAIINWSSFNINGNEHVWFIQPGSSARVLNRILGADPSMINGGLTANGIVYFVNPAGIMFGPNSVINVGGIYAAAGHISDLDFNAGINRFTDLSGTVSNFGALSADQVHLIGRHVANHGTINANGGVLTMLAGNDVLIQPQGENIMIKVDGQTITDQNVPYGGGTAPDMNATPGVLNTGTINVNNGNVVLGAGDLYSLAVKNAGMVNAAKGTVTLAATDGLIHNAGSISVDAMSGAGGNITIQGPSVVNTGHLSANSGYGVGGNIEVTSQNHTYLLDGSSISAQGLGNTSHGGNVLVHSYGGLTVFADGSVIDVSGGAFSKGGFVEVSGLDVAFAGDVNLYGGTMGKLLIDPLDIRIVEFGDDDGLIMPGGEITFDIAPDEVVTISASTLFNIAGTILLQAERDIYIQHVVLLNGQDMILEAGRHIALQETIIGANNLSITSDFDFSGLGGPASDGIGVIDLNIDLLQVAGKLTIIGGGGIKVHGDLRGEGLDLIGVTKWKGLQEHVIDAGDGHLFVSHDIFIEPGGDLTLRGNSIDVDGNITVPVSQVIDGFGTIRILGPADIQGNIFAGADAFFSDTVILDGEMDQSIVVGGLLQSSASIIKSSTVGFDLVLQAGTLIDVAGNVASNHGDLDVFGDALIGGSVDVAYEGTFHNTAAIGGHAYSKEGSLLFMDDTSVGEYVDVWNNVDFNATADVGGDVLARNGYTNFDDDASVGGNVTAATFVTFDEDAIVGGDVHAGKGVFIGDAADDFADIDGDITAKTQGVHVIGTLEAGGNIIGMGVELLGETILDGAGNQTIDAGAGLLLADNVITKTTDGDLTMLGGLIDINVGIDVAGGSLTVDGPTLLAGNVSAADTVTFTSPLILEGDTTVTGTDAVFNDRINSAPGTSNDLTIDAVNTLIEGTVGGNNQLGTFRTVDRGAGDETTISSDLIHAKRVLLEDAVILEGDQVVLRGDLIVDFGSTVDGKTNLIVRGGTIHVGGDVGGDVQLSSIDMQVIDAAGLIDIDGERVHAHGDILLNDNGRGTIPQVATIIGRNDLTVLSDNGVVRMGRGEKLTVDGDLAIIAGVKAVLGDLNAGGDMSVQAPLIEILARQAGTLLDGAGNVITDLGVDFVAGGGIFFSTTPTVNGAGPAPIFYTPSGEGDQAGTLSGFTFGKTTQGEPLTLQLADGTVLDLTGVLVSGDLASAFALFPFDPIHYPVPQDINITIGEIIMLQSMGVNARSLSESERAERLMGRGMYDNMYLKAKETQPEDTTFTIDRTTFEMTTSAYDTFNRVMGSGPGAVQSAFEEAWQAYQASSGTAALSATETGVAFRCYIIHESGMADAIEYLQGMSLLLHRVRLIGLNDIEYEAARDYLLTPCTPHSMTPEEFEATLLERCPGEPDLIPVKSGRMNDDARNETSVPE